MARIRSIKPEFFSDEDVGSLPPLVRLLFIGMWCEADKAGRLKDRPKTLKARCMPFDSLNIEQALTQLAEGRFIIRYEAAGDRYIQIRTWAEHQRPHHTEKESTYPSVVEGEATVTSPCNNGGITVKERSSRKREPSSSFPSLPKDLSFSEEFGATWEAWVKHRAQIKKPLTPEQTTHQLERFREWGEERSSAAIHYTIEMGWQGIREPPPGHGGPGSNGRTQAQRDLAEAFAKAEAMREEINS